MKINACKEMIFKPKINLSFSADLISFKLDNTTLLVFENILELPLNANIQGTGVSIKKVFQYSRGSSWKKFDEDHCL